MFLLELLRGSQGTTPEVSSSATLWNFPAATPGVSSRVIPEVFRRRYPRRSSSWSSSSGSSQSYSVRFSQSYTRVFFPRSTQRVSSGVFLLELLDRFMLELSQDFHLELVWGFS